MTADATNERDDGFEPSTHAPSEASAFVFSLLSGPEQQGASGEDNPPEIFEADSLVAAPEPALAESEPISNPGAQNVAPGGGGEPAPSRPTNRSAPKRRSKIDVPLMIVSLGMLTVGSGLAIGYGVFGRQGKPEGESIVQEGRPPAAYDATGAKTDRAPAVALNANVSRTEPGVNSGKETAPSLTHVDPRKSVVAQMPTVGSEQIKPPGDAPQVHSGASISSSVTRAGEATSARLAGMSAWQAPSSVVNMPKASTSARSPNDEAASPDPMQSVNMRSSVTTSRIAASTLLGVDASGEGAPAAANKSLGEPRPPLVISLGRIDPCQLIHSVRPVYPRDATKLHVEGNVELRVVVGTDGTVQNVSLVSGLPLLAPAAMDAARQFRYKPAMLNGQPIETVQTVDMSFKLKD